MTFALPPGEGSPADVNAVLFALLTCRPAERWLSPLLGAAAEPPPFLQRTADVLGFYRILAEIAGGDPCRVMQSSGRGNTATMRSILLRMEQIPPYKVGSSWDSEC